MSDYASDGKERKKMFKRFWTGIGTLALGVLFFAVSAAIAAPANDSTTVNGIQIFLGGAAVGNDSRPPRHSYRKRDACRQARKKG